MSSKIKMSPTITLDYEDYKNILSRFKYLDQKRTLALGYISDLLGNEGVKRDDELVEILKEIRERVF